MYASAISIKDQGLSMDRLYTTKVGAFGLRQQSNIATGKLPSERLPMSEHKSRQDYWKRNLRLVTICLGIWFVVSYLFGIVLVDQLNAISIAGYDLGFWFAQQGSMSIFVVLIFFYAWRMNKLDREFDVHED